MRLESTTLTRFRSLPESSFRFGDLTAVVGQNSAGKSALLRGLNCFFNLETELDSHLAGRHQHTPRSQPRIDVTFAELPDVPELRAHAHGDRLRLRMILRPGSPTPTLQRLAPRPETIDPSVLDLVREHFHFVLVPPHRDPSKFGWKETTLLRQTIEALLERHTERRDHLSSRFREATAYLERRALDPIAKELKKFYGAGHDLDFDIRFPDNTSYRDFLADVWFRFIEAGTSFEVVQQGTGVQSLTIIALHRLLASLRRTSLLLGIEEPEANLHPQAQRELIHSFRGMLEGEDGAQLLFTTHSTVLIDQLDHEEAILVRKLSGQSRGVVSEAAQLEADFIERHDLEQERYERFHRYRNSDFFFASLVIVVEGEADDSVVRHLLRDRGVDPDASGISVLTLDGGRNLKYLLHLLRELGIPHLIVLDKDHFLPYANGDLASSRYGSGFPKYRYEFKAGSLVEDLVPSATRRTELLRRFRSNHSRAMDLLGDHGVICMNYNLEMDLVASKTAASHFHDVLGTPAADRSTAKLLVEHRRRIKQTPNLLEVLRRTPHRNLPHSYRRIKRVVPELLAG